METIQEAKDYVFADENFKKKGVKCPCCDQFVKSYLRNVDSIQARALIILVQMYEEEERYFHVDEIKKLINIGNWIAKLKLWGLIEEETNKDTSKRKSGNWKPTDLGIRFAKNQCTIPKYCRTYNMGIVEFSDDKVNIITALGKKFHYQELMNRIM